MSFTEAVAFVQSSNGKRALGGIADTERLKIYALFKQATVGPLCSNSSVSKPSILDFVAKAKWNAWNELGSSMTQDQAKMEYIQLIENLAPGWKENSVLNTDESDESAEIGAPDNGIGKSVSRPIKPAAEDDDNSLPLLKACKEGNLQEVETLLSSASQLNDPDEMGMTALHWAADGGHEEIVCLLISQQNIDLNIQDETGQTPLHIAAVCGHESIVRHLITAGCDRNLRDSDGKTALELAEDEQIKHLLSH